MMRGGNRRKGFLEWQQHRGKKTQGKHTALLFQARSIGLEAAGEE